MKQLYRKDGRSVRIERWGDCSHRVTMSESGIASLEDELFSASPAQPRENLPEPALPLEELDSPRGFEVEHATVTAGIAAHEVEQWNEIVAWRDSASVIHVELIERERRLRVRGSFGGDAGSFEYRRWIGELDALSALPFREAAPAVESLLLDRSVAAELIPLIHAGTRRSGPAELMFTQRPPSPDTRDGSGSPIVPSFSAGGQRVLPNVYRPSYRYRPRPMPLHLAIEPFGHVPLEGTRALAIVEHSTDLTLLCSNRREWFVLTIDGHPETLAASVAAVADDTVWYPSLGGCWGATMMLK